MLLALAGVTGVGKSFYKDLLVSKMNFRKVKIITTRKIRHGEINNEDKIFVSQSEMTTLKNSEDLAYNFEMLGNEYAYLKEDLFTDQNTVFELHYDTIYDFKKLCPNLCTIYIYPKDLDMAIGKINHRGLTDEVKDKRIKELKEHYNNITNNENLRKQFDYVFFNNYDKDSEEEFLKLVRKIMND